MSAGHLAALGRVGWELASLRVTVGRMHAARFVAVALAIAVLSGCSTAPNPAPSATPTTRIVQAERAQLTPGPDGKVEGAYPGTRLRVIPSESAPFACRPPSAAERRILAMRGNRVDQPAGPAAVDLAEGWALVASWGNHGDRTGAPYMTALLTDGATFQELPLNGRWLGTHTNAGVAFEGGPDALKVALECIGAALP